MKSQTFQKKLNEIFVIEPNDLGFSFMTNQYKKTTQYLKKMPFIILVPLSFALAFTAYSIFGYLIVRLTSILQYGF